MQRYIDARMQSPKLFNLQLNIFLGRIMLSIKGDKMKIEAKNLVKIYGDRSVVNDVSFSINKGEVVCLLGPNGAGKTTTFYMIVGLIKPNKGKIFLNDEEITTWPMHIRARAGIGYLPQEASSFRSLSVEDNLKLVLEMNDKLTQDEKRRKL